MLSILMSGTDRGLHIRGGEIGGVAMGTTVGPLTDVELPELLRLALLLVLADVEMVKIKT